MVDMVDALKAHHDEIVEGWLERVWAKPRAAALPREVVLDNFVALIDEIIAQVARPDASESTVDIPAAVAEEHGRSRLQLGYGLGELGEEYNSLRQVFIGVLNEAGVARDIRKDRALHAAIDVAHRRGVERFIELGDARLRARQSEFLAKLTHDFRAPLAGILTNAMLLRRKLRALPPDVEVAFARSERAAKRLLALVEGQLATEQALAGRLRLKPQSVALETLVSAVCETLVTRAEARGLDLALDVPDDLVLNTDPMLLGQLVQNLVDNAVKYTDAGEVRVVARGDGHWVEIVVEDTGRGIPAEIAAHLFDIYRQSDQASSGRGVGLAVVKSIAETLGGEVRVERRTPHGTRFIVRVPGREEQARALGEGGPEQPSPGA